jgi:hypothetical protein
MLQMRRRYPWTGPTEPGHQNYASATTLGLKSKWTKADSFGKCCSKCQRCCRSRNWRRGEDHPQTAPTNRRVTLTRTWRSRTHEGPRGWVCQSATKCWRTHPMKQEPEGGQSNLRLEIRRIRSRTPSSHQYVEKADVSLSNAKQRVAGMNCNVHWR